MRKIPTDIPKSLSAKSLPRLSNRQTPWFSSTSGSRNSSCAAKNSRKTLQRRSSARDFSRKRSHSSRTPKKKPENKVIFKIPSHTVYAKGFSVIHTFCASVMRSAVGSTLPYARIQRRILYQFCIPGKTILPPSSCPTV